ncbi:MAG: hypothetical protein K2J70_02410 [Muribaculaceae bacterium]|nr:hypothetical protein [Muribaculaceae bacterium]
MGRISKSKTLAWAALILCIALLVISMAVPGLKTEWWQLFDVFFLFMTVFSHLAAIYLEKMSKPASQMLDRMALIFGILAIISFIAVFIIDL